MDARPAVPRAIVATTDEAVREFLAIHLEARGFAVERVHRSEYLRLVAPGTALLFADLDLLEAAALAPGSRPGSILALSREPSADGALRAAAGGARRYIAIPFSDPRALAETLDALAAETRTPEPELVGAR